MRLGEILLRHGLITQIQLDAGLLGQQSSGLRLGTHFVEEGILTTDEVALALAEQFDVPPALEADFVRADPTLRHKLVVHQAVELQSIPLFATGPHRIAVAMANPKNFMALDRLAFILGATIDPMVATELALQKHLGILYNVRPKRRPRPVLAAPLPLPKQAAVADAEKDTDIRPALRCHRRGPILPPPAPPPNVLRFAPLKPFSSPREPAAPVEVMEDAACFTPTPLSFLAQAQPRLPPKPTRIASRHPLTPIVVPITSASAQLAVDQIRFATDQQDLSDSLFTFMRACFPVGAMFLVAGAIAQGRFGFSEGLVRPEVETLRLSLTLPSCLRIARSRRGTYQGAPPPDGMAVQSALWSALGSEPPVDVLVSPVIVDNHVTLLLYAQGDPGRRINGVAAQRMEQVCQAISSSLLRLAG